jgi:siroheme synthase (precorrin-2 oxidase/ferrochelatase)
MDYLPIFMRLRGFQAVIGGGVTARKAGLVVRSGARVVVVSPAPSDAMRAAVAANDWRWIPATARHR